MSSIYRGRFAPSPTGSLHFGSLVAAVGSYLQAKKAGGEWLVRIEDLDPPREVAGAASDILRTLERFGFEWDGEVLYQSTRTHAYEAGIERLRSRGLAYACSCSRAEILCSLPQAVPTEELRYPGTCRGGVNNPAAPTAIRFQVPSQPIAFIDGLSGAMAIDLIATTGDFVIRRRDGLFAYQLAVVVDDAEQGITEVVRGADLLTSTPRQIALQRALGLSTPGYVHLPLATDELGRKLSKSTQAPSIDMGDICGTLWQALQFLGQRPAEGLVRAPVADVWKWAIEHWSLVPLTCRE